MARSRSIPVSLLKEPDYFELSAEARVVFVGLILEADDEGRGRAHPGLLARLFNVSEAAVEEALCQLVERGLLLRYEVGRQQYYQWLPWRQWQTLSKPTPSQLPPPPAWGEQEQEQESAAEPALVEERAGCCGSGVSRETLGFPGKSRETQLEEEGEGEREREKEEEHEREKEEGKMPAKQPAAAEPGKIVPFPASSSPPCVDVDAGGCSLSLSNLESVDAGQEEAQEIAEIAEILGLPHSRQLCQVLEEFAETLSWPALRGEAIECAEYVRDPRRNQKRQWMSPGFFRRWLKRVQAQALLTSRQEAAAGPEGTSPARAAEPERDRWPSRRGNRSRLPAAEPAWHSDPIAQYRAYVDAQRQRWLAACQAAEKPAAAAAAAAGGS